MINGIPAKQIRRYALASGIASFGVEYKYLLGIGIIALALLHFLISADLRSAIRCGQDSLVMARPYLWTLAYSLVFWVVTLAGFRVMTKGTFYIVYQLIAIFAIKYQASRNVEWALRVLRRSRIEPVLAVRSGNITPGLIKRRFGVDVKPVYPDVSTRLALSDLSKETVPAADAIIYRDGLMPFAEVLIGSRRCCRMVYLSMALCWLGCLCGLLLGYYLTGVAAYSALSAGYMLVFLLLWLLPTVLLGDLTGRY